MMNEAKDRLKRLIDSDLCSAESVEKHQKKLNCFAEQADLTHSRKQSKLLKALADEKRLMIIKLLMNKEMCLCELMIALKTTQPNLSHHLKTLEDHDLINRRKQGKWAYYSITDKKTIKKFLSFINSIL